MSPGRLLAGPLLALSLALAPAFPAAAANPRVAVVVTGPLDDDTSRLETRLRAELLVSGFEVLTVVRPQSVGQEELARIASESGSAAAVCIVQSDLWLSAEIWLSKTRTGPAMLRQVRPEPLSRDAPAIVAIRAAEILRASALDLRDHTPPPATSSAPAATSSSPSPAPPAAASAPVQAVSPLVDRGPAPTPEPSAKSVFAVTAALSALGGPGGVATGFGPTLAFSYAFAAPWSAELRVTGPVSSSVDFEQGSIDIDQEILVTNLRLDIDAGEQLTPFLLVGGGAMRAGVRGQARAPYQPEQHSAWSAVGVVETGVRLRASSRWAVRSGLGAFVVTSRPVVVVDDQAIAYLGRPGFHGTLGFELGW